MSTPYYQDDWVSLYHGDCLEILPALNPVQHVIIDPPYATSGDLYSHGDETISADVRDWCLSRDARGLRIVLCGYDTEHDDLLSHGWTVTEGKAGGGSGYSTRSDNGRRERLWLSPGCHTAQDVLDFTGEAS